jgi:aspartate/methionine/tyrosine aminotransferase
MTDSAVPFDRDLVRRVLADLGIDIRSASIREMNAAVTAIERALGVAFIRMEFGVPGLRASPIALEAESRALGDQHLAHVYASFEGLPALKEAGARFWKLFTDIDVPPSCVVPTIGAMQGCFASIALGGQMKGASTSVLCLGPGFPENRLQARMLGVPTETLDFYDHRGARLIDAIERRVSRGDVGAILWSSPNNPTWIVLKPSELEGIGRLCTRYDVLAVEDLAYFGMDTREDYTVPGQAPYQPTVMRYTDRAISIVSSSKMFSYAGQRIALTIVSPGLMALQVPALAGRFGTASVGRALVDGIIYPNIACVPESPQHGLRALLEAANGGDTSLFEPSRVYAARARAMKRIFLEHGFRLVYDNDLGEPLADGFYFTIAYPGFDEGSTLLEELLHYGISAITLNAAGSCRTEGLRACVSMTAEDRFGTLDSRLRRFRVDHPVAI